MIKLIEHKLSIKEAPIINKDGFIDVAITKLQNIEVKYYEPNFNYGFSIMCFTDIDALANVAVYRNGFDKPIAEYPNILIKVTDVDLNYSDFEEFIEWHYGDGERDLDIRKYDESYITDDIVRMSIEETLLNSTGIFECDLSYFNNYGDNDIEQIEELNFDGNYVTIELPDGTIKDIQNSIGRLTEASDSGVEYDYCTKTTLANIKNGEYFTFVPVAEPREAQVWVKDDYNRSTKKYIVYKWANTSAIREFPGTKEVYIDFTF